MGQVDNSRAPVLDWNLLSLRGNLNVTKSNRLAILSVYHHHNNNNNDTCNISSHFGTRPAICRERVS